MTEECSNVLPPLVVALDDILHLGGTKRGLLEKQNSDHDRWGFTGVIRLHLCHLKQNGSRVLGYSGWCHHFEYVIMLWKEPALIRILSFYFEHKNYFLELVANRSLYNLLLNNIISPVDPEGGRCHPHQIPDHTPMVGNESIANKWLHVKGALNYFLWVPPVWKKRKKWSRNFLCLRLLILLHSSSDTPVHHTLSSMRGKEAEAVSPIGFKEWQYGDNTREDKCEGRDQKMTEYWKRGSISKLSCKHQWRVIVGTRTMHVNSTSLNLATSLPNTHTHTHRMQRKIRDKVELTRHKSARLSRCTMFALWRATFVLTVTPVKVAASLNDGDNYSILANIMWPHSWCLSY